MAKKSRSESDKKYFTGYNKAKNKEIAIERHMAKHPNDSQSLNRSKADYSGKKS